MVWNWTRGCYLNPNPYHYFAWSSVCWNSEKPITMKQRLMVGWIFSSFWLGTHFWIVFLLTSLPSYNPSTYETNCILTEISLVITVKFSHCFLLFFLFNSSMGMKNKTALWKFIENNTLNNQKFTVYSHLINNSKCMLTNDTTIIKFSA